MMQKMKTIRSGRGDVLIMCQVCWYAVIVKSIKDIYFFYSYYNDSDWHEDKEGEENDGKDVDMEMPKVCDKGGARPKTYSRDAG